MAANEARPASLEEIGSGVWAWLQRGSWGYSNAGLVTDSGSSLLVDTLFDLPLTRRMLDEMRRATPSAECIGTVVNTHANGDHCWGNQLVGEAEIVSSRATADEMLDVPPRLMEQSVALARGLSLAGAPGRAFCRLLGRLGVPRIGPLGEAADFVAEYFGPFDFRGIEVTTPTRTFENRLTLDVGAKRVELVEVGPAHTKGDVVVHVPDDRIAFTGDILFVDSHPILWEGPVANWVRACDWLLSLDVDVIVPGHGPLTDKAGVRRTKEYWERLVDIVRRGIEAEASDEDVAREILAAGFDGWGESHRAVANVAAVRRELLDERPPRDPAETFALMARFEREHGASS